jgi:hypothetical protein
MGHICAGLGKTGREAVRVWWAENFSSILLSVPTFGEISYLVNTFLVPTNTQYKYYFPALSNFCLLNDPNLMQEISDLPELHCE